METAEKVEKVNGTSEMECENSETQENGKNTETNENAEKADSKEDTEKGESKENTEKGESNEKTEKGEANEKTEKGETSENTDKAETKENENATNAVTDPAVDACKNVVAAAGINVETPIVNALIGNLTGTLPTKKTDGEYTCDLCHCAFKVTIAYDTHIKGSKHKKKLEALNILKQIKASGGKGIILENEEIKCVPCQLTLNSPQQLEFHLEGAKHKKNAGMCETETDSELAPPVKKTKTGDSKDLTCEMCNIFANSVAQFNQHLSSKKHIAKKNNAETKKSILGNNV